MLPASLPTHGSGSTGARPSRLMGQAGHFHASSRYWEIKKGRAPVGNKEEERPPQSRSEQRLMPEARQMSLLLVFQGIVTCRVREDWKVQLPHFAKERPGEGKGLARSHTVSKEGQGVRSGLRACRWPWFSSCTSLPLGRR